MMTWREVRKKKINDDEEEKMRGRGMSADGERDLMKGRLRRREDRIGEVI